MCGDRLLVINEGQVLSSVAASQESLAKIMMMLAAAVFADSYGRKPVMLVGMACTAISTAFFVLACIFWPWAKSFFILGQALQGAYPVELLFQLVTVDLACAHDADKMGIFELQGIVKFLPVVCFGAAASGIQMMELESYLWLWCCVFLFNCILLALTLGFLPETKTGGPGLTSRLGFIAGIRHELNSYHSILTGADGVGPVKLVLLYTFVDAIARAKFSSLLMSTGMSYYSMSAAGVIAWVIPIIVVHTTCTPVVGIVCRRLGMRRGFVVVCMYKACAGCLFILQPFIQWSWFAQYYLSSIASGWDALVNSMDAELFRDEVSKYVAVVTLCKYGSNLISAPMYAALFDAKATSYQERLRPGLVSFALYMVGMLLVFTPRTGIWAMFCRALDGLQADADLKSNKLYLDKKAD